MFPNWRARSKLPVGVISEWKLVIVREDGSMQWQDGDNHFTRLGDAEPVWQITVDFDSVGHNLDKPMRIQGTGKADAGKGAGKGTGTSTQNLGFQPESRNSSAKAEDLDRGKGAGKGTGVGTWLGSTNS
eukprot:gnl/TRDRNA2_/TRDRNA2_86885_c0_seq2.p1 gnl/TRDRNA2_/TRDRNA2_86885_c0~~gnl/TRDRNA2_/TRDRNA2_86885_c0_seq2.p1  ORF type:complete len:129 (+),score=21.76 gnl/TRDRNA2_/TRDRNA2_86885_c0_seq2:3-389(+)